MPLEDQLVAIGALKGQGKNIEEIAEATGLEIGDVQSALSGALPAGIALLPESFVAQEFTFAAEIDLATTPGNGADADVPGLTDFVVIPAFTFFAVNYIAELSSPENPSSPGNCLNMGLSILAKPTVPPWGSLVGVGQDPTIAQGISPALSGAGIDTWTEVWGGSSVSLTQLPQDANLGVRYVATQTGLPPVGTPKVRNLTVSVVTMKPALAA